jgi:hypothetical protein
MACAEGAYYVFQSESVKLNQWRQVMEIRHDDPNDIHVNKFALPEIKSDISFSANDYAVTNDAGESWRIFKICEFLRTDEQCAGIKDYGLTRMEKVKLNYIHLQNTKMD